MKLLLVLIAGVAATTYQSSSSSTSSQSDQSWDPQMLNFTRGGQTYVKQAPQFPHLSAGSEYSSNNPCNRDCGTHFSPKCASNGLTYWNLCTLQVATCRNPFVHLVRYGHCSAGSSGGGGCHRWCDSTPYHVCASNGLTYHNTCYFNRAKCQNPHLYISYVGFCYNGYESPWGGLTSDSSEGHRNDLTSFVDEEGGDGPLLVDRGDQ